MGSLSLFTGLFNAASAMQTFTQTMDVVENNVVNANTPGYVRQDPSLTALPFDPSAGLAGGVLAGSLISSRSEYLEQAVRTQASALGDAKQRATDLAQIEPVFDLTSSAGIANAINGFFNSFSQLAVNPNDLLSRQSVLTQASNLAQSLNSASASMSGISDNIASQTASVAANINQIAGQIAAINKSFLEDAGASQDAGLDAQMHSALENLSSLTNYTVLKDSLGAYNVYIGGQTPLVIGAKTFDISAITSSGQTQLLDSEGNDITAQISGGSLAALVGERNATIPGYISNLNTLAQSIADTVNTQLSQGLDQSGAAPTVNMFAYDQPSNAAATISVTSLTPDQVAAAAANAPGGNGNAIAVAQLASFQAVNGQTFTQFYGALGAAVGSDVANAQQDQNQAQDLLTQAQSQRAATSSVSLNEEAIKILQFQQAYQAAAKVVTTLETLTQTVINLIT